MHEYAVSDVILAQYNAWAKEKYKRPFWRNIQQSDLLQAPSLVSHVRKWAGLDVAQPTLADGYNYSKVVDPEQPESIGIVSEALLGGGLVIIPNGSIYVFFGLKDCELRQERSNVRFLINQTKLRHPLLPIVRLADSPAHLMQNLGKASVRQPLEELASCFRPIGFLLPRVGGGRTMHVLYDAPFVQALQDNLRFLLGRDPVLYVSSANFTTMGAHKTLEGVLYDFGTNPSVRLIVNGGTLKMSGNENNSSTIIEVDETRELTFFRIGYPPEDRIRQFLEQRGVQISVTPYTRTTSVSILESGM